MAQLDDIDYKLEYVRLLDLLARVINTNKGFSTSDISDGERLWDAHCLANKFIGHALSMLHLSRGTSVQELPSFPQFSFIDSASVDVLTRAAMEAFLVFHYVFYAPQTKGEKDYRYWAYKTAGLAERQNFPTITEEGRRKLDNEKTEFDELHNKLESNEVFQSLKDGQKGQIFEGKGNWKWKPNGKGAVSRHDIAIDAGLSKMVASDMYRHLSGYTHSSSLSVLQSQEALLNREEELLISGSIITMNIVAAKMVREYCRLFPKAQDVLSKDLEGSKAVKIWIEIDHGLDA